MTCDFINNSVVHEKRWLLDRIRGLREKIIDRVLFALNNTSQSFARSEIVCRSVYIILAASSGRYMYTMLYRIGSFAKSRIEPPIRFHNFINVNKKTKRTKYRSIWYTS